MAESSDYRQQIYAKYASVFGDESKVFDSSAADRWGNAYDKYLKLWLPDRKDAAILEVGCGGGKLLHFFKKRGYTNLTGVDISEEQVTLSRQVCENIFQADVLGFLKGTENKFDMIISLDFIEHLDKDKVIVFFNSCHRALKPGGHIILQTPNGQSPFCLSVFYDDFTHLTCFIRKSLIRSLLRAVHCRSQ